LIDKIRNFAPEQDKIYILDGSSNHKQEQEKVARFVQEKGWEFNKEVHFIIRKNWVWTKALE
jgi:hypothetical protein